MNQTEKYTCIKYTNENFLIANKDIFTAAYFDVAESAIKSEKFDEEQFVWDIQSFDSEGKIENLEFSEGQENGINYVNFDSLLDTFNSKENDSFQTDASQLNTCIVLNNRIALLTSAECFVVTPDESFFRKPEYPYSKLMEKIGIEKYCFYNDRIYYVLDINAFLKKTDQSKS